MLKIKYLKILLIAYILLLISSIIYFYTRFDEKKDSPTSEINFVRQKKDWTNFTFLKLEKERTGPGEKGRPVILTDLEDINEAQKTVKDYSYNAFVSDKISLDRSIPDTRMNGCLNKKYFENLPPVTIIVVFHNEYLSILLRTIHSIINRTPAILLKEIILVDDFSDKEFLKSPLEDHLNQNFPGIVNIIRLKSRSGLVKARMAGIRAAKTSIVVVMDAHMEVNTNWLQPLIQPIVENNKTVTEPVIDHIDWNTLEYVPNKSNGHRGSFSWSLVYKIIPRISVLTEMNNSEPFANPVLTGGIMAINRKWFWELQGYDDQLEIWGGEQYDLTFKIWRCGGNILRIPCSHVGHNYKGGGYHPYMKYSSYYWRNLNRVVEIWFDNYKEYYYKETNSEKYGFGDISKQIKWRNDFGCKSFQWYIDNVFTDFLEKYPISKPSSYAHGTIKSFWKPNLCVDMMNRDYEVGVYECSTNSEEPYNNQYFIYTFYHQIRKKNEYWCWDVNREEEKGKYLLDVLECHDSGGHQNFFYDQSQQTILTSNRLYCLDLISNNESQKLLFVPCIPNKNSQKWIWGFINETATHKWITPTFKK